MSRIMVAEFPGWCFGVGGDVVFVTGSSLLGGVDPRCFRRFSDDVATLRQLHGPSRPLRNTVFAFQSPMYIDDGLFVEMDIGDRKEQTTAAWRRTARPLLSEGAINGEKQSRWRMGRRSHFLRIRDEHRRYGYQTTLRERGSGATTLPGELFA